MLDQRLRAVAVVHVPVHDEHAVRPSAWACRAATTTLFTKQKPIARAASAWCPGGRVAANAVPVRIAAVTACSATPAEACTASQLRGPR